MDGRLGAIQDRQAARRRAFAVPLIGLAAVVSLVLVGPATAAPSDLDSSFGSGGKVVTNWGGTDDAALAAVLDGSGRLVVAGKSGDSGDSTDFAVARYTPSGALDTSFGGGDGIVTTPVPSSYMGGPYDAANAVAIDSSGRIVAAGTAGGNSGNGDIAVVRYTAAGVIDTSFGGGDGIVTTNPGGPGSGRAVAIDGGGNIVVGGSGNPGGEDMTVVRYTSAGVLDTSFGGGDGIVTTPAAKDGRAVELDGAGRILLAGGDLDFTVARFTAAGVLDTSFGGGDGLATTHFGQTFDLATAMNVASDGTITLAGETLADAESGSSFALARFTPSGSLDTTFGGGDGSVVTPFGTYAVAYALAIDVAGRIVLGGVSDLDFALARYTADGSLDPTFDGQDGLVATDLGDVDSAYGMAVSSSGSLTLAGSTYSTVSSTQDVALARYAGGDASAGGAPPIASAPGGFGLGGTNLNKHKGTATLKVEVPGPGTLSLSGNGIDWHPQARLARASGASTTVAAAGVVKLVISAKGWRKKKLNQLGKVKVRVTVTFTPVGGVPAKHKKSIKLKKSP